MAANYTAIVSDLHLCEEEPIHPKFPLWKKYKTKEFFFDDVFSEFLLKTQEMAKGEKIELILNGDIFDFDSVLSLPEDPPYRMTSSERKQGLYPQEEKSVFKIRKIIADHVVWITALKKFVDNGHRAVFIVGNHDLELHFAAVQDTILNAICEGEDSKKRVRFSEWFYISNSDTLVEHGNQYDPYCRCEDPINPFVESHGTIEVRLPFGSWATRHIINSLGYFNPHVDTNFIMTFFQYIKFFFKYMARTQPLLIVTWMSGSFYTLMQTLSDQLRPSLRDPLSVEARVEDIARRSNSTSGVVRQLSELFTPSAARNPFLLARELWLDRAAILIGTSYIIFNIYLMINSIQAISIWWFLVPCMMFLPPLIFYSSFIDSDVMKFKEPQERILSLSGRIARVQRVVYGHTHIVRHEIIGGIEHLNSGCWSPAFLDVECTKPIDQKTFVWISPEENDSRKAMLYRFDGSVVTPVFSKVQ
ncbi:MAG: hypothetical protein A4S09_14660 [Proteobacteria bacterium SG_bin7]|nr:MAG: hypothetical protein A4S09_14660 [Proteobacteria bacterium SG_bin7]